MITAHGPYPLYREPDEIAQAFTHYGISLDFSRPLISTAAKLIYFSHTEIVPFNIPSQLPHSRAHAIQLGYFGVGPTRADIIEVNSHVNTKLVPQTKWDWWEDLTEQELEQEDRGMTSWDLKSASSKWDNDWMRLAYCSNPWVRVPGQGRVHTPGSLTGLWQGRMLVRCLSESHGSRVNILSKFPNEIAFMELVATPGYPENLPPVSTAPVYMRLQEHHCVSPQFPVDIGGFGNGFDDGLGNAYFPPISLRKDAVSSLRPTTFISQYLISCLSG
jgi:hypothetical protein